MDNLKVLFSKTAHLKKYFILAIVCVTIETAFEIIIPLLMSQIIDVGIANKDRSVFLTEGAWMLLCAILSLIFGLLYARFAAKASASTARVLRKEVYDQVLNYSFSNIDHFETPSLITRLTSDISLIQNAITNSLRPLARGPLMLVLGMMMCLIINWKLSLVFFFVSPVLAGILIWIVRKVAPRYSKLQSSVDALNEAIQENLVAIRLVKACVKGDAESLKFEKINAAYRDLSANTFHYALFNLPAFQLSMYTTIVVIMVLGIQMILSGEMMVGELTGILSYVLQILNSFMMMSNVFLLLTRSMASVNRVVQIFDEVPEISSPDNPQEMKDGSVEFKDVSFSYNPDAKENVLDHINLNIQSGEKIGIMGGTGSAKTTLVSLIDRLYDVKSGEVRVGKRNVKDLDLVDLRDKVAIVLQNNVLFSGSVKENLLWGNPDATKEQIDEVCRIAAVDELLEKLPGGLEMELGQGGVNVSGGQKQRICIARALLKNPKILIFDDSTSAVDTKTNARIIEGLSSLKDLTQIIIAQRIESLEHCDRIVVLDNGTISAIGTKEELMKTSPIFREIVQSQQKGEQQ